ncbi:YqaH family protein [Bacillus safensis]|uniref:YqaH family protein n=1 Tax=Bacillus safensis TaxID=561879 RepID=UPI002452E918|nr:YqaH family protein [Bacillus safensis]MDH3097118.1 YqaH family protein [Bacillus safensis]
MSMIDKQFLSEDIPLAESKIDSAKELLYLAHQELKDGNYEEVASLAGSIRNISEDLVRMNNKGRLINTAEEIQKKHGVKLAVVKRTERTEIIEY